MRPPVLLEPHKTEEEIKNASPEQRRVWFEEWKQMYIEANPHLVHSDGKPRGFFNALFGNRH